MAAPKPIIRTHYTDHEIAFLGDLGMHAVGHKCSRLTLLTRYRAAAESRAIWGDIDRHEVAVHLDKFIAIEESRNARRRAR